jgi:YVTN family beta-propeller protein
VTGYVGASNWPEGDALYYSVTRGPTSGTVTLDPSTGAFTFTPSASARAAGGLDSFTVAVSDGRDVTISVDTPTWYTTVVTVPIGYVEHPSTQTTIDMIDAGYGPTDVAVGGTRAYVVGLFDLTAIDTTTNQAVATASLPYIDEVAAGPVLATPDGNRVYIREFPDPWNDPYNQVVIAYDGTTLATVGDPLAGTVSGMAVSADSTRLYVGFSSGTIVVVDTASNAAIDTIPVNAAGYLAVSADGERLYAQNLTNGTTSVVDLNTKSVIGSIAAAGPMAVSADGNRVYVAGSDGTVSVVDAASRAVTTKITVTPPGGLIDIAVSADGTRVYAEGYSDVYVIDVASNTVIGAIRPAGPVGGGFAITSDGRLYVPLADANGFDVVVITPSTSSAVV